MFNILSFRCNFVIETYKLSYIDMKKCPDVPVLKEIAGVAWELNVPAYVIGGFVRDTLLGRKSKDIDILVIGSGIHLARQVADKLGNDVPVSVFKNFGTAMIKHGDLEIEFVGARKESYQRHSRKPIVENGSLEDDQKRRDFTINALAWSLNKDDYGQFIDPFTGLNDLQAGIIRTPLGPGETFSDDPLRMLRAIRFAAQLKFTIEKNTLSAIASQKERINIISGERVAEELHKILLSPKPSIGLRLISDTGLMSIIFPELEEMKGVEVKQGKKHKDNFLHTIKVVDNLAKASKDLWLRWAALLHDVGKPRAKKYIPGQGWSFHGHDYIGSKMIPGIFKRMKLPLNEKMKYVKKLVALHLRPMALVTEEVTDSAVRRLLFEAGDDIDDLMKLCEADITSQNMVLKKQYLENFKLVREKLKEIEEKDAIRNFQPPVSGEEIMEYFQIPPSRPVGIIKEAIKEAILEGAIGNNHEEAHAYMVAIGKEMGLIK